MQNYSRMLIAAAFLSLLSASAGALPVVKTYKVVSNFTTGSINQVTSMFTLNYDPSVANGPLAVSGYSSSSASPAFDPALVQFTNAPMPGNTSSVAVGGSSTGINGVTSGAADFRILFFVDPMTGAPANANRMLIPFNALTDYSLPGSTTTFETFDTAITLVSSAVPETATWGMMMVGLSVIGSALRHRRSVSTRVSFV